MYNRAYEKMFYTEKNAHIYTVDNANNIHLSLQVLCYSIGSLDFIPI